MAEAVIAASQSPRRWRKPPFIRSPLLRWVLWLCVGLYLAAAFGTLDVNWARVMDGGGRAMRFLGGFFPPDFSSRGDAIIDGVLESLWMAVVSTVFGILLSIPLALGAARNLAPAVIYYPCRAILMLSRTFQEIIVAILLVKLFGFGTFAGFLTLTISTVGFYGKLLAEDMEAVHPAPLESVRATGAGWPSWLVYSMLPQVLPRATGLALYRLDINFRESAVIGIVGAGGIGATLTTAFDRYEYDSAAAIMLVIIALVLAAEYLSGFVRDKVR